MINCKSQAELDKMRRSGQIVRQVLDGVKMLVAPGVSTMDLEHAAEEKIREFGAKPAFKGYCDYPCVLCTSVNNEIIHGIPSEKRVLKEGDIVSIDCGVVLDGYYGDSAITVPVGKSLAPELQKTAGRHGNLIEESDCRGQVGQDRRRRGSGSAGIR